MVAELWRSDHQILPILLDMLKVKHTSYGGRLKRFQFPLTCHDVPLQEKSSTSRRVNSTSDKRDEIHFLASIYYFVMLTRCSRFSALSLQWPCFHFLRWDEHLLFNIVSVIKNYVEKMQIIVIERFIF